MNRIRIIIIFNWVFIGLSCSTITLKSREGLDQHVDYNSFEKLNGNYKNSKNDTVNSYKSLYYNFKIDSLYQQKKLIVNLNVLDKNNIKIKLIDNERVIDSLIIKGKFRGGYFKIKRQWNTSFIAGPLLWILVDNIKYVGLTKANQLVIIDSGTGGIMLLVVFPIFAAESGQFENEYERIK